MILNIIYTRKDDMQYKRDPYTDKFTMDDGVQNEDWSEIAALTEECAQLAGELRGKLEELQSLMFHQYQCYIKDKDGDYEGINSYDIEDYAAQVSEIEENLSIND